MMDTETHQVFSNILRLLIVSLEEVEPMWEECDSELEKITYIIKNMHLMDKNSKAYKSREYNEMFDAAEISSMAAEDIVAYSQSQRKLMDMQLAYDYAREEGFQQGMEEGMEKGMEQGMERERVVSIRIMRSMGILPERIAHEYNMSLEQVRRILEKK